MWWKNFLTSSTLLILHIKVHNQSFIAFPLGRRTLFLHFISSRKRSRLQIRLESLCIEKKMSKKIRGQRLRVHPSNPWVFFDLRSVAAGSQDELQQGLSMRVWGQVWGEKVYPHTYPHHWNHDKQGVSGEKWGCEGKKEKNFFYLFFILSAAASGHACKSV